jgi:hypothetical protein
MSALGLLLAVSLPLIGGGKPEATVSPCLWGALPPSKDQALAAPDFATFDRLRRQYSEADWTLAFSRCGLGEEADGVATKAVTYYEASLWTQRRLAAKWPAATLEAAVEAIPEKDLAYFWQLPAPDKRTPDYLDKRARAQARVYKAFGRAGPVTPLDDLDIFITSRVGWRLAEIDYRRIKTGG